MEGETAGKVTLAPSVLTTIVTLTVNADEGVARLCKDWRSDVSRFLGVGGVDDGVRVDVEGNSVAVDVHLVAKANVNLLALGRRLQAEIARAISDTVGLVVREVNIFIEDVELPDSEEQV
ncbi:MAG: Asp23/Gls24 family envelope stress response protein [Anaerolineae bacterium]|nr:Asp23/Gls24 family envelope stress response protein [Anaerolineae bacterium]